MALTLVRKTHCHLLGAVRTSVGVRSTRGNYLQRKRPPVLRTPTIVRRKPTRWQRRLRTTVGATRAEPIKGYFCGCSVANRLHASVGATEALSGYNFGRVRLCGRSGFENTGKTLRCFTSTQVVKRLFRAVGRCARRQLRHISQTASNDEADADSEILAILV